MKTRRAFTLIELMVVVGIMAFLGVAATGGYNALQRGMAERGATAVATSLLQAAKERALVDRSPAVVFCFNRMLRKATDDDPAIYVGEAVAVRRAGRITRVQGKFLFDEFADLCNSYDVEEDQGALAERRGMKLWRFDDREMSDMRYSIVADAVFRTQVQGVSFEEWSNGLAGTAPTGGGSSGSKGQNVGQNIGVNQGSSSFMIDCYAFYNLNQSAFEPSGWTIGDGYGFEFANVQLPHNYIFSSGNLPTEVGDVRFVKAIYFDVQQSSTMGQSTSDDTIDVYHCRPGAGGGVQTRKAGTAGSKETTTI